MENSQSQPQPEWMTHRVDEEGYIEDVDVQTRIGIPMCFEYSNSPVQFYQPESGEGYIAFNIDDGPEDIEVRLPFDAIDKIHARLVSGGMVPSPAVQLLKDVAEACGDQPPFDDFFKRYYQLTGEHMVLTEEGWVPPHMNTREYLGAEPSEVLDEVNRPE